MQLDSNAHQTHNCAIKSNYFFYQRLSVYRKWLSLAPPLGSWSPCQHSSSSCWLFSRLICIIIARRFLSAAFGPKKPEITSPKMKAHHLVLLGMCSKPECWSLKLQAETTITPMTSLWHHQGYYSDYWQLLLRATGDIKSMSSSHNEYNELAGVQIWITTSAT